MKILNHEIPIELLYLFCGIFIVLILCSIAFGAMLKKNPSNGNKELVLRTNSWWKISIGV